LDFSSGIKMGKNYGVVVTNGVLHDAVLKALEMGGPESQNRCLIESLG